MRDLGALTVAVDAQDRPLRGTKAAAILALLVINANHRVSVDALMEAAWGEHVTAGSASTLESHIWGLRRLLEPRRGRREAPSVLVNEANGYRLVAARHSVDSLSFLEMAGEVADLSAAGRFTEAVEQADRALGLWRGRPYTPFTDESWVQPAAARLDELHDQLLERRVQALVAAGLLDQALADLDPLLARMPFREPLWGLRMQALHGCGRTEESLQTFHRARRVFQTELGIDPGQDLRDLHRRLLANDPGLTIRRDPVPASRPAEVHLPTALTALVGRDDALVDLVGLVGTRRLVTITGAAGCGKTRLAVDVARAVAGRFPDGVWFIDLTAVSDPDLVVDVVASTIGFAASAGATENEDVREYLRARRILLVLDNCEHVLTAVAQMVETALGDADESVRCAVLATSREPINLEGETVWTLHPLGLPGGEFDLYPGAAPAVDLFLQRLASAAPQVPVDEHLLGCAVRIAVAVDGLPLPLELAAARARNYTLDDIVEQVDSDPTRLGRVGRAPADHRSTVRSTIEWSYRLLDPDEQSAHRKLSVLPGPFTRAAAAAVLAEPDSTDPEDLLARLAHRSMLVSEGATRPGGPTLFRQLATIRAHAAHALSNPEGRLAQHRRNEWAAALIGRRPRLGSVGEIAWYHALDDGYATVRATLADLLIDEPTEAGGRLAARLTYYWYYRSKQLEGNRWAQLAVTALADAQPLDLWLAEIALASEQAIQGRIDLVRPRTQTLLPKLAAVPDDHLIDVGEALVGLAATAYTCDAADVVLAVQTELARVAHAAGDDQLTLLADAVACIAAFAAGDIDGSVRRARQVYERAEAQANLMAGWMSVGPPMIAALLAGRPDEGQQWATRLIQAHLRLGVGAGGSFIETKANFATQAGDYAEAVRLYAAARTYTRRAAMIWPRRQLTRDLMGVARFHMGAEAYERAWQAGEQLSLDEIAYT